jgi:hypothetical protein
MDKKYLTLGEQLSYEQGYREGVDIGILSSIIMVITIISLFTSL